MMATHATRHRLSIMVCLIFAGLALRAQQQNSGNPVDRNSLAAGPFLFGPGTIHPTPMDWLDDRPVVKSPDGKLQVTVTGPKQSYEAWVTISSSKVSGGSIQIWPIQRNVAILWKPDSGSFALTDDRYSNLSYVLICGTEFRMGESDSGLGVLVTDLTPIVRNAFEIQARKYYHGDSYEIRLFYARVLSWVSNDELLIGVSARTFGPSTFPNGGQEEQNIAYQVDLPNKKILRELDKNQLWSEYKIKAP